MRSSATTPLESAYHALLKRGRLSQNVSQAALITRLSTVQDGLSTSTTGPTTTASAPTGLYIHGSVGTGKSYLASLFTSTLPSHVSRRRAHFHEFMLDVHSRLHVARSSSSRYGSVDPLPVIGRQIHDESRVLCFDEFQVTDIADAMILQRLMGAFWAAGGVMVATSNREPDKLYEDGLNRELFLPFIAMLKYRCETWALGGTQDYRLLGREDAGENQKVFFTDAEEFQQSLSAATNGQKMESYEIPVMMGRKMIVTAMPTDNDESKLIVFSTFAQLCEAKLGAADYHALCRKAKTIYLDGLRRFRLSELDFVRRFITLIDLAYESGTRVVISSSATIDEAFAEIVENERQRLMRKSGGLKMSVKKGGGSSSIISSSVINFSSKIEHVAVSFLILAQLKPPTRVQNNDSMETSQATIAQRSYTGCRTCRQRKVKCDENRDDIGRCGSCSRLNRQCDWTREWKFIDSSRAVGKQYVILGKNPHPVVRNDKHLRTTTSTGQLTRSRPLMFVNSSSVDLAATIVPAEPQSPKSVGKLNFRPISDSASSSEDSDTQSIVSRVPSDMMNYGTRSRDNAIHPLLFDKIVCRKIMPMAVRFKLNIEDDENVLLSSAKKFVPLRHAICAITLLNSGMKNRPELIAGSFQHYDRAITACRSMPDSYNCEAVFFLHFILLMYDIACASQRWPEDRGSWSIHLRKLACLARVPAGTTVGRLQAYLSWYVLLLDAQAGLAGNPEAGHYTRAFLDNGRSLPVWPISQSQRQVLSTPGAMEIFLQTHKLSLITFEMFAEQSQASLKLRSMLKDRHVGLEERQQFIQDLKTRREELWQANCPSDIDNLDGMDELGIIRGTYNFARLQYSILQLHLHTSMYPYQRLDGDAFAEEDARHCTYIIETVRQSFVFNDKENHHLASGLFLAGAATRLPHEKAAALIMLKEMEHAGLSGAVARVRNLLELVVREQAKKEITGGKADEVDWIELSKEHGLKNVVFGM
ncbi:AFG1-like ATPase, partial [Aureobasidium melanogenum]